MKGVIVEKVGDAPKVVDTLEVPEPGEGQVLVKSLYAAINPVDAYMAYTGQLVVEWPFVLGCDVGGVVVKTGPNAVGPLGPLKVGDGVCGCSRLGSKGYSTCEEYLLMDTQVTFPKPKNIDFAQAATIGSGVDTACLGIFHGLGIDVPKDLSKLPDRGGEWVLVFGGPSSVGKAAVQILSVLGFKVITTASPRSFEVVKGIGASAVVNYKSPEEEQVKEILSTTGGNLYLIFDAASQSHKLAAQLFAKLSDGPGKPRRFTTTNDWDPMDDKDFHGALVNHIMLGPIGRPGSAINAQIESYIPLIVKLIEDGRFKTSDYEIVGTGFEAVLEAYAYQQTGKAGHKKVLIKLQDA